ncbi:uncharacterized protein [Haliotis cracherodii]|uniref:uncharacterized protein n=1 Tax=Haliotis cracherodii TaxID=6455 RepID=UPI0039EC3B27
MAAPTTIIFSSFVIGLITPLQAIYPFRNTSLSIDERVADLINRLSLDEIAEQMAGAGGGGMHGGEPSPAIPRLGIGKFVWSVECLRGDGMAGNATSFPQALGLAASFNREIIYKVATATAAEVRAKNNDFVKRGIFHDHTGLGCFSPVINIMRHPLWGRNQETYGEDPYLTGDLAAWFVRGLQGSHPRYLAAAATCKHFAAYDGPEDLPVGRESFNAKVSEFDLRTTFLPQFKSCVKAGASGVMCSYNSVNGIPACLSKYLLTDVLRTDWGFPGYVVSDAGALEFSIQFHHYLPTYADTAAAAVQAGLNLELAPDHYNTTVYRAIPAAVERGQLSESLVRERVKPVFATRLRLGEFDPPSLNPYTQYNLSLIQSPEHQDLSLQAAIQSLVLLKNDGILPLKKKLKTLALIGPMANTTSQIMGDYSADVEERYISTVLDGIALSEMMRYSAGCDDTWCREYWAAEVIQAVSSTDATVLCLGTGQAVETENFDRVDMLLPGKQKDLLQDVIKYSKGPVILLLFSGGPLDIRLAVSSAKVAAILQCFFPAQATGKALQSVLTLSDSYSNPAGRLPFTWYASQQQVPKMTDYSMKNKTYRYFTGQPLYPFGYGLSYSKFKYTDFHIQPVKVKVGESVTITFKVTNLGPYDGDEVVQVYMSWHNSSVSAPHIQLVAFDRIHLRNRQTVSQKYTVTPEQMAVWVTEKGFVVEPGEMTLYMGPIPAMHPGQGVRSPLLEGNFTVYR